MFDILYILPALLMVARLHGEQLPMRVSKFIRGVYPAGDRPPKRLPAPRKQGPRRKVRAFAASGKSFGAYLRQCRFRNGRHGNRFWSLRSVARRAEISPAVLSQVETGKRRAVADDVLRLAAVLNESREELLVRAGYLPSSALVNRGGLALTTSERRIIIALRSHPQLLAPLIALANSLE
jgi:transcriptional regulator with XRE-family HTH domain